MDYLTATEVSAKWNISSRMVAYHCENNRISGALKKGKTWFIPINAEKPDDKRYAKQKTDSRNSLHGEPYETRHDREKTYYIGDIYHNLGLTRETLRYYEKIGLIKLKRSQYSKYREFDLNDISNLLAIDFFRKRGFAPTEIKELQSAAKQEEYAAGIHKKINSIYKEIENLSVILQSLNKAEKFFGYALDHSLEFVMKELPPYFIQEAMNSVTDFNEYKEKVLNYINLEKDDMLSNMARIITFDESGYKTSGMYLVKPAANESKSESKTLLKSGKCLYTTLIADNNDDSVMEPMFYKCYEWAKEHNLSFRGEAYIFIKFVVLNQRINTHFYEVWIPIK